MNKALLSAVLIAFSALTAHAVVHAGGIIAMVRVHLSSPEGWQIFADLVIVLCLLLALMYRDAQATGRRFWLWAVFSLTCGSFGPLLYFLTAKKDSA
jgi:uncharacterized membrane protein